MSTSVAIGSTVPTRLRQMRAAGLATFEKGLLNLNLVGVRAKVPVPNKFSCHMEVHYKDTLNGAEVWYTRTYPITTLPGSTYLEHPMRKTGCAILLPGQYRRSHVVGKHKDRYPALIQQQPMMFVRDNTHDAVPDLTGPPIRDIIGCNIHASDSNPFDDNDPRHDDVGPWSAACQVFKESSDYRDYWNLVLKSARLYGPSFTYTLLEGS